MKYKRIVSIFLSLAFYVSGYAYADSKWFRGHNPQNFAEKIQTDLHLTEEQYKNVEQILKENSLIVSAKFRDLKEQIYKIRNEISQDSPNLELLKQEVEKKAKILSDMEYAAIVRDLRLKAQFSKEQVDEWRDISQKEHSGKSMGPRFFRDSPPPPHGKENRHGKKFQDDEFADAPPFDDEDMQKEFSAEQKTELAMIMQELREDLDLSEEQFKQVENILQKSSQTLFDARGQLLSQFWNIRDELLKEEPDLKKIRKYLDEKSSIIANMEYTSLSRDLRLRAILPKEELEDWEAEVSGRFIFRGEPNPHEPFMMIKNKRNYD